MELYNILKYNGRYLEVTHKNIPEDKLQEYGVKDEEIFQNDIVVGYTLLKGNHKLYAIKDCK